MKKAVLYFHGKGGSAGGAEFYKPFFPDTDVIGIDYRGDNPWNAREDILAAYRWFAKQYDSISIVANSIGAYFSMNALSDMDIEHAYFISPVVDMERLMLDIMSWSGISESELADKKVIVVPTWDEPFTLEYLTYTREHPVSWSVPTDILYGEKDVLIPFETITKFVKRTGAKVTVMKNGEHWFHSDEQIKFHDTWLKQCVKK